MYSEFLGEGYTNKLRHMLTADDKLLPDRIINADLNIGGMKQLIMAYTQDRRVKSLEFIQTEEQYKKMQDASTYYLAGILCTALKSRTSSPPYNTKKYKKDWDKKRSTYIAKGNLKLNELLVSINKG